MPRDHPEIIHHREGFDFVPGNRSLSAVEVGLVNVMSRETVLRRYVDSVKQDYGEKLPRQYRTIARKGISKGQQVFHVATLLDKICQDMCCGRDKAMKLLAELNQRTGIGLIERIK